MPRLKVTKVTGVRDFLVHRLDVYFEIAPLRCDIVAKLAGIPPFVVHFLYMKP